MSFANKKLGLDDRILLLRQLALLAANGIGLPQAVRQLSENNDSPAVRAFCRQALEASSAGSSRQALIGYISPMLASLSESADTQGHIQPEALYDLADVYEKAAVYRGAVAGALAYPIKVFLVALLLWAVMLVFVVPVFDRLFAEFGGSLPEPTKLMIGLSRWVQDYIIYLVAVMAGAGLLVVLVKETQYPVLWLFRSLRKLVKDYTAIQFCHLFSILLKHNTPLHTAFKLAAEATPYTAYSHRLKKSETEITHPSLLKDVLKKTTIFSTSILALVDLVDSTAALPGLFEQSGKYLSKGFENQLAGAVKTIEIAAFMLVAVVVGTMVFAMYLPIFKMAGAIG